MKQSWMTQRFLCLSVYLVEVSKLFNVMLSGSGFEYFYVDEPQLLCCHAIFCTHCSGNFATSICWQTKITIIICALCGLDSCPLMVRLWVRILACTDTNQAQPAPAEWLIRYPTSSQKLLQGHLLGQVYFTNAFPPTPASPTSVP